MPEVDFAADDLPDLPDILDRLREQGPVSPIKFAGKDTWLINDYQTVKQAIADDVYLSAPAAYEIYSTPTIGKVLSTMTGAQHRLNRAVVANVFFPKKMRELADTLFAEEAELLVKQLAGLEQVDLVAEYTRRYTFNNIASLLGVPRDDVLVLEDWADRIMHSYLDLDSAVAAGREMGEYLQPIITARRSQPTGDVISLLIEASVDGEGLSDEEVLAFCRNLFPAAIDTSTNSLGSLIYLLLKNSEYLSLLNGEKGNSGNDSRGVDKVIDEMLRLETPLVMIPRKCVKQLELGGFTLMPGDDIRICISGANLDPGQFQNPREFDPNRKGKEMTFGHGEHFCLGSHMARRVIETGLLTLFKAFPKMALCSDKAVEIVGGVLRGPRELWVRLD